MKKYLYIALCTLLGLLLATVIHALIEIPTLTLITRNFATYENSFLWQQWDLIHGTVSALLWVFGALGGYWGGKVWWQILYVEERYGKPRF